MPWTLLLNWRIWAGVVLAGIVLYATVQTKRLHTAQADVIRVQAEFDTFKARVVAEGKSAQERSDKQAKEDLQRQKEADNEAKKRYASLDAQYAAYRLRQRASNNATSSLLPTPASGTSVNSSICYTRSTFDNEITSAVGRLRSGIADDSLPYDQATLIAKTCKEWARH